MADAMQFLLCSVFQTGLGKPHELHICNSGQQTPLDKDPLLSYYY